MSSEPSACLVWMSLEPALNPGRKLSKAPAGVTRVDGREREEHEAENTGDPWHGLGHGAGLTEGRARGKSRTTRRHVAARTQQGNS